MIKIIKLSESTKHYLNKKGSAWTEETDTTVTGFTFVGERLGVKIRKDFRSEDLVFSLGYQNSIDGTWTYRKYSSIEDLEGVLVRRNASRLYDDWKDRINMIYDEVLAVRKDNTPKLSPIEIFKKFFHIDEKDIKKSGETYRYKQKDDGNLSRDEFSDLMSQSQEIVNSLYDNGFETVHNYDYDLVMSDGHTRISFWYEPGAWDIKIKEI